MKAIKSIFAFLFIAAIPMLSFTACGDDEPAANTWTVVKNGKTYSYDIKSAVVYHEDGGCSLLFLDEPYSVTKPINTEPTPNWCAIDIPLKDNWFFRIATSDCRPDSEYAAAEISNKKQSFSGPSSKGEYKLTFSCKIPDDNINISINYKGIPQVMNEYFWHWYEK